MWAVWRTKRAMYNFNVHNKIKYIPLLVMVVLLTIGNNCTATNYFVDSNDLISSNANSGLSRDEPWLTIDYAMSSESPVMAGDIIYVMPGTYYETVNIQKNGIEGSPIVLQSYDVNNKAVIDGAKVITGWEKCSSQIEALGNINWNNIYKTTLVLENIIDKLTLFENGDYLKVSQWPNQSDDLLINDHEFEPFEDDEVGSDENPVTEYLVDKSFLTQPDDYWNGAWVYVWSHAANNSVFSRTVADYICAENKIVFDYPLSKTITNSVGTNPDAYSIANHIGVLDVPGEYYYKKVNDNTFEIYLWPYNASSVLNNKISCSSKNVGIYGNIGYGSYITISDLEIRCFSGSGTRDGAIIVPKGFNHSSMSILNCYVHETSGTAAISLRSGNSDIIRNCIVENIKSGRGIFMGNGSGGIIDNNTLYCIGSTCIRLSTMDETVISNNKVEKTVGHGNGITAYENCSDVLIAYNTVQKANIAFTMKESNNFTLYNNLFYSEEDSPAVSSWGGMTGYVNIINNIIQNDHSSAALSDISSDVVNIVNNIISGTGNKENNRKTNFYTRLAWNQKEYFGWYYGEGEKIVEKDDLFIAVNKLNFKPLINSAGVNQGSNITSFIPLDVFSDFDFSKDIQGNSRILDSNIDIGPYEFVLDTSSPSVPSNLTCTSVDEFTIKLTWDNAIDNETGISTYRIFRDGEYVADVSSNIYIDTELIPNRVYNYQVSAVNGHEIESAKSTQKQGRTLLDDKAPLVIGVNIIDSETINVSFNERLDVASVTNDGNYYINDMVDIKGAVLNDDGYSMTIKTSAHQEGHYNISISGIMDISGNSMAQTNLEYDFAKVVMYIPFDGNSENFTEFAINTQWQGQENYTQGVIAKCIDTTSDAYIEASHITELDGMKKLAISVWAKKNISDIGGYLVKKHVTYQLTVSESSFGGYINFSEAGTKYFGFSSGLLLDDDWHNYVLVYDGNNISGYVDSLFIGSESASGKVSMNPTRKVLIGKDPWGDSFQGCIDEVRIYNDALTEQEIINLYNSPPPQVVDLQLDGIVGTEVPLHWSTNEAASSVINCWPKVTGKSGSSLVSKTVTAEDSPATEHSITLTGLSPETEYYYSITCTDEYGNSETYEDPAYTFTTLSRPNTAPVGNDGAKAIDEDAAPFGIDLSEFCSDADGDNLSVSIESQPTKGTLGTPSGLVVAYQPDANVNGQDSFTYRVSDGSATDTGVITINIASINDAPVAGDGVKSVVEDAPPFGIDLSEFCLDADGDSLTLSIETQPTKGILSTPSGLAVAYKPDANATGQDSFVYRISDGSASDTGVVTINMTPVNDGPVGVNDSLAVNEDRPETSSNLLSNDIDIDGDTLTIVSASDGTKGTVVNNNNGTVTYTPNADESGSDTFTYTISDGNIQSTATVSVYISPVNDKPVAANGTLITNEDIPVTSANMLALATDAEGDTLTISGKTNGSNGTVVDNGNGTLTYTPTANFSGSDTFTYSVSDGKGGITTANINVNVASVPDTPVLSNATSKSGVATQKLSFDISATDADGDGVSFEFSALPDGAKFVDNGDGTASFNWTPGKGQADTYTVDVTAKDNSSFAKSVTKTINISISSADNNVPVFAQIGSQSTAEMSELRFTVFAVDSDGDTITYDCTDMPAGASFNADTRTFSWTPDYEASGSDYSATFTANDGFNGEATLDVAISVTNLNRDPVFGAVNPPAFKENTENSFNLTATDADGDSITYTCDALPTGASLDSGSGLFTWKPGYSDSGTKTIVFKASDTNEGLVTKAVSIVVNDSNQDPVFTIPTSRSVQATNKLKFLVTAEDPDNDQVTITCDDKPADAAFDGNTNSFAWIPESGTSGTYTAKFTAKDSKGAATSLTVSIYVDMDDQPPTFTPVVVDAVKENETVSFIAKATDPEGKAVSYSLTEYPAGATINAGTGQVTWKTDYDDAGGNRFVVSASDGSLSATLTVDVVVNNVNRDPEVSVSGNLAPIYSDGLNLTVLKSDPDGDAVDIKNILNLPNGAVFDANTGLITWKPERDMLGDYKITLVATDGFGDITKDINFTIADGFNQLPIITQIDKKEVDEGGKIEFVVIASDPDGDPVKISVAKPSGATFMNNTFSWITGADDIGSHSVTFTASDGKGTASMTVAMVVNNINVAPIAEVTGTTKLAAGQTVSLKVDASDPDGDLLNIILNSQPKGMELIDNIITWTSSKTDAGTYKFTVEVSDGKLVTKVPVSITVAAASSDKEPPLVLSTYPENGSIQVPLNPLISFTLADYGEGVDYNTVTISIDGEDVFSGDSMASKSESSEQVMFSTQDSNVVRTGSASRYTFQYQAVNMFDYDYTPEIVINAKDLMGNQMEPYSIKFTTEMFSVAKAIPVEGTKSSTKGISQSKPAVAVSPNGTVWSAWTEGKVGSRKVKFAPFYDSTGQFDAARTVRAMDSQDMAEPDIVAADDGSLYFVWQDNVSGNWDVNIGRSSDGINTDMTATVATGEENQTDPAVVIDKNGDIYVTYVVERKTGKDIYVAKVSSDLTSVFETVVCSNTSEQSNPVIAAGSDGDVHIAWEDYRDSGTSSVYAASLSGSWQNYKLAAKSSEPAMAVDTSCDYLHASWTSNDDIYYCKVPLPLSGKAVSAVNVIDDTSGAVQSNPSIYHFCNSSVNRTIVAWTDARNAYSNNDYDIYLASVDKGSMTNMLATIDTELGCQTAPAVATNISGAPYIVFQDQSGEGQTIQMACASVIERMLSRNVIDSKDGGYVGVRIEDMDSEDDVTIIVPADALSSDIEMSIARVSNPPGDSSGIRSLFSYDFGPSSTREFRKPVNIIIPYPKNLGGSNLSVYWYNPQTGSYSQSGMSNIQTLDINSELKAISFNTTHFSQYSVSAEFIPWITSKAE